MINLIFIFIATNIVICAEITVLASVVLYRLLFRRYRHDLSLSLGALDQATKCVCVASTVAAVVKCGCCSSRAAPAKKTRFLVGHEHSQSVFFQLWSENLTRFIIIFCRGCLLCTALLVVVLNFRELRLILMGAETGKQNRISPLALCCWNPHSRWEMLFSMLQQERAALATHNTYHRRWCLSSQGTKRRHIFNDVKCEGVTYWAINIIGVKDRSITQLRAILITLSPPLNGGFFGASEPYTFVCTLTYSLRFIIPGEPGSNVFRHAGRGKRSIDYPAQGNPYTTNLRGCMLR